MNPKSAPDGLIFFITMQLSFFSSKKRIVNLLKLRIGNVNMFIKIKALHDGF